MSRPPVRTTSDPPWAWAARPARRLRRRPARRGFVLVVVSVVILLISLAAYGFLSLMQVESLASRMRGDQLQAAAVAAAGREYLAAVVESPRSERPTRADTDDAPDAFAGIRVGGDEDDRQQETEPPGQFAVLAPQRAEMSARAWRFGYENESSKLHLGILLQYEQRLPGAGRAALMRLPNMDESTADAILDWIDPDDAPRERGAESDYYRGLTPPVQPRQDVPPTLEELLLVRGVTREKLFGWDLDVNYRVDDWETDLAAGAAPANSAAQLPWCSFLTVYSSERDESYDGRRRIVLNQPNLATLHQELAAALEPGWAHFIVAYRQFGPSAHSGDTVDISSLAVDLSKPPQHALVSAIDLIGARVAIPGDSDDQRTLVASPLSDDPVQLRTSLPKLMDRVTVGSGSPRFGRVNVNLAEREVLSAIPGFDSALAERVAATRTLVAGDDASRSHPVWLLTEDLVDREQWRQIEPWVTAGGDVVRAQVLGFFDLRRPCVRFETVVDGTGPTARELYYKDLQRVGPGILGDVISITQTP